jgi:hypothetical protein
MQRTVGNSVVSRVLVGQRVGGQPARVRSARRLQRQLVRGSDGLFTDTRDVGQPRVTFEHVQGDDYRETATRTLLTYTASHQFQHSGGSYYDPYTKEWYQPNEQGWYFCRGQWYSYDGAYYRPYVQQPNPVYGPQPSPASSQSSARFGQATQGHTTLPTSSSEPASSQSSGKMTNDDFRKMLFGSGKPSLSAQLAQAGSLNAAIKLLRGWENPAEALALVRSSTHERGFKGLRQRIADRATFVGTERGHRGAEYETYWLYYELLLRVGASTEDTELQETCKRLGFDKHPGEDPEGGVGGVGGVRGGPTTGPKQRVGFW